MAVARLNELPADVAAIDILGVSVRSAAPDAVVAALDERLATGLRTRVAFLNANLSNVVAADPRLGETLSRFMVLNDGFGVDLARGVLHGARFSHNLNGTDFVPRFLDHTRHRLRIFLVGGAPETVMKAQTVMAKRWPRHLIVGVQHGFFGADELARVSERISKAAPHLVLAAMGNPRQETWIDEALPRTVPLAIGVGALFDFLSGRVQRAPERVRRWRLEWAYRLVAEPRRLWRRYLVGNPKFLGRVAAAKFAEMRGSRPARPYVTSGIKRGLDIVGAGTGLLALSPLLVIIGVAIKVSSPGPVLFRQTRNGLGRQPFRIYKFRTMRHEPGPADTVVRQAERGDDRVTAIGRVLRKTSLDELPQLLNVLKGDMSLVGPRPHAIQHDAAFAAAVEAYERRFAAKPGISGWAQVNGARGETPDVSDVQRRLDLDLEYIDRAGIGTDIAILVKTIPEVFASRTAY